MHEHHDWHWESARRQAVQRRIECLEADRHRRSLVPVDAALEKQMKELRTAGLPDTIQLTTGLLIIRCNGMQDLLRQLVLVAKMADSDYESLRALIEAPVPRRSPASETEAADRELGQSASSKRVLCSAMSEKLTHLGITPCRRGKP
jgi:hypothetical protein